MTDAERRGRAIFRQQYPTARNFMTPAVVEYGLVDPDTAYELSRGSGIEPGTTLWGVTVVTVTERLYTHRGPQSEARRTRGRTMRVMVCDECGYRIDDGAHAAIEIKVKGSNPRIGGTLTLDYCDECAEGLYDGLDARRGLARIRREEATG